MSGFWCLSGVGCFARFSYGCRLNRSLVSRILIDYMYGMVKSTKRFRHGS